ncbi:Aof2 protein [Aphelenchoides avenae]|nr:Aof2 protein [Aphelenchus avenae]
MFDKPFWDTSLNLFGRLNESPSSRGEMFLFFANGENPVLTGLMAGEAASHANNEHREQLVQRAMTILQQIFPQCPARVSSARSNVASNVLSFQPVNCAVTMWHLDRFSRGCYSYLSTQCSPDDFDVLARPLCDRNEIPRIFFAGEHTNRQYLATVHGAMLSGLREAARVADTFLGHIGGTVEAKLEDKVEAKPEDESEAKLEGEVEAQLEDKVETDSAEVAGILQANGHGAAEQSSSAGAHVNGDHDATSEPPSKLSEMVRGLFDCASPVSDEDSVNTDPLPSLSALEVAEPMDVDQKSEVASSYATAPDVPSTSSATAGDVNIDDDVMKSPQPPPFSQETFTDEQEPALAEEEDILGDGGDTVGQEEIDAAMEAEILGEEPADN